MDIFVVSRAVRTREYTRTVLDFVNDFFVPFQGVYAVCTSKVLADGAASILIEEMADDCHNWQELPYQLKKEWATWKQYLPTAWQDAVQIVRLTLREHNGEGPPEYVTIKVRREKTRVWGGNEEEKQVPIAAYGSSFVRVDQPGEDAYSYVRIGLITDKDVRKGVK